MQILGTHLNYFALHPSYPNLFVAIIWLDGSCFLKIADVQYMWRELPN